jgi:hypothetical protein
MPFANEASRPFKSCPTNLGDYYADTDKSELLPKM